jgi:AraC-like DNA-binding protein
MTLSATDPSWAEVARCQRELARIIERCCDGDGLHASAIPGLTFYRASNTGAPTCGVCKSALALAAQGAKRLTLGDETYEYDRSHYLITSVELPVFAQVTQATAAKPYLGLILELDMRKIGALLSEMAPLPPVAPVARGLALGTVSAGLLDPAVRLARLLETPADIPVLAPLIERELHYRLLTGEFGARLRSLAVMEGRTHQIARAIDWLKAHFSEPLSIDTLAQAVNMSRSSLHHHFKAVTVMSPLQYQKHLRLQEARRLMLVEMQDAASAGHRVGYESPSQFSRDYSRLFGAPPLRDIARLRRGGPAEDGRRQGGGPRTRQDRGERCNVAAARGNGTGR